MRSLRLCCRCIAVLGAAFVLLSISIDCVDEVNHEAENLLRAFITKCQEKAISGRTVRKTVQSCAEPHLRAISTAIPSTHLPQRIRQIYLSCLRTGVEDFCSASSQANARTCVIRQGISSLPEIRRIYETHRQEIIRLVSKIGHDCTAAIKAL